MCVFRYLDILLRLHMQPRMGVLLSVETKGEEPKEAENNLVEGGILLPMHS